MTFDIDDPIFGPEYKRNIERAKTLIEPAVKARLVNGTPDQIAGAIDAVMKDDTAVRSMAYSGDVWSAYNATSHVERVLATRPDLSTPVPSVNDVAAHLLAKKVAVFGQDNIGALRIAAYREAEIMSETDRAALGIEASPPGERISETTEAKAVPLHAQPYSWSGWEYEVGRVTGLHPSAVLPSKRKEIIDHLKAESLKAATGNMHPKDVDAVASIKSKPEDQRTAAERVTLHRLGG